MVRTAALRLASRQTIHDSGRPCMLPVAISESLCTAEQQDWWNSVYKVTTNTARSDKKHQQCQYSLNDYRLFLTAIFDVNVSRCLLSFLLILLQQKLSGMSCTSFLGQLFFLSHEFVEQKLSACQNAENSQQLHEL